MSTRSCAIHVAVLVLAPNSKWFRIYWVTGCYSSHLFLCALEWYKASWFAGSSPVVLAGLQVGEHQLKITPNGCKKSTKAKFSVWVPWHVIISTIYGSAAVTVVRNSLYLWPSSGNEIHVIFVNVSSYCNIFTIINDVLMCTLVISYNQYFSQPIKNEGIKVTLPNEWS